MEAVRRLRLDFRAGEDSTLGFDEAPMGGLDEDDIYLEREIYNSKKVLILTLSL